MLISKHNFRSVDMAANQKAVGALRYFLGYCMPSTKQKASKIRIRHLDFDKNLLAYFSKFTFVYAHDPDKICKTGDTVLIQSLPEKMTRLITHKVIKIVYPFGDVTDPITGKKVVVFEYRDEVQKANELYGISKSAFDYEKAPPRGYQENIRDYTHLPPMLKYHEDPDDPQPGAT